MVMLPELPVGKSGSLNNSLKAGSKIFAEAIIKLGTEESGTVPSIVIESEAAIAIFPAFPAAALEASTLPPSNRLRLEVSMVKLPASAEPKVEAVMALGAKIFGSIPITSIVSAAILRSPPSPVSNTVATIVPPCLKVRELVVMLLFPAAPAPKLAATMELVTLGSRLLEPTTSIDSSAFMVKFPPLPVPGGKVLATTVAPPSTVNWLVVI